MNAPRINSNPAFDRAIADYSRVDRDTRAHEAHEPAHELCRGALEGFGRHEGEPSEGLREPADGPVAVDDHERCDHAEHEQKPEREDAESEGEHTPGDETDHTPPSRPPVPSVPRARVLETA